MADEIKNSVDIFQLLYFFSYFFQKYLPKQIISLQIF